MKKLSLLALSILLAAQIFSQDTVKVMFYNVLNFPGNTSNRKDTLKKIVQYYQPDIFMITELQSQYGNNLILNNSLNVDGVNYYASANFIDGPDSDNMLYFNTNKFALKSQNNIPTDLRDINEYVLYYTPNLPAGDTIYLYCYVAHLKASQGYENERNAEVQAFIDYIDQKSNVKNVFFAGDLNLYGASEPAYATLTSSGNIPLYDPVNRVGEWHNNASFSDVHTQSTRVNDIGDGGSTGGLDDRFDFIFISNDINTTGYNGVKYISNTYKAIGQDGLRYDQSVINPTNQDVPSDIASALYYMSDHLPVKMEIAIDENFITSTTNIKDHTQNYQLAYIPQGVQISHRENIRKIEVYNILGNKIQIYTPLSKEYIIHNATFAEGIYFLKIFTETGLESAKIKF